MLYCLDYGILLLWAALPYSSFLRLTKIIILAHSTNELQPQISNSKECYFYNWIKRILHLVVLCHLSGAHVLENIQFFICLAIKQWHVSLILNAVNFCVSSSSFALISQGWLFVPFILV